MLERWSLWVRRVLQLAMALMLLAMVAMVFANVVLRYGFNRGLTVAEELSRWLFVWLVFLGAALAVGQRAHMGVDLLVARLPLTLQRAAGVLGHLLMLAMTGLLLVGAWQQTLINWETTAPVTGWSQGWLYASGVVFGLLAGSWLLADLVRLLRGQTLDHGHGSAAAGEEPSP